MIKRHLIAAFLLGTLLTACDKQVSQKKEALKVCTETVAAQSGSNVASYVGQIEEYSSTTLSFTGTGTIRQMLVSEGQRVGKGQLVAVMDETQMQNALQAGEAALKQAQDAYNRLKQVYEAGSLPEQQWVEMQAKLQQAQSARDMAKKALEDCRLVAPVSGVIGSISLRAGETALTSMPVCTVLDISRVKVKVSVPEREIGSITQNTPTTISVQAAGKQHLQGGTIEKGVTADAVTRTYDIKILLPNADGALLPGMVAGVSIQDEASNATERITLPVTAVQENIDGSKFVWVVEQGKAKRQGVSIGELTGNRVIITGGLQKDQQVIVEGYQKVSEGEAVTSQCIIDN